MNNKFKKMFIVLLIMFFTVACSNKGGAGSTNGKNNGDPLKAYEGTTLNLLLQTGYDTAAVESYKSEFEKDTGIKLNIEIVDEPTLRKKFVLDSTSHTGNYDVVTIPFWFTPEYIKGGYLEPLNDYMENLKTDWLSTGDIPEGLKESYQDQKGNLYAVPVTTSGGVLMYRKDLFEEYGIPVPQTTKDVLEAAKKLKEKLPSDIVPFVGRGSSDTASFGSPAGWAWAYGASVLNENGEVTVNSNEMNDAMNDWVTLLKEYGPQDAGAMGWESMSQIFLQGKAAMNYDMSGFLSTYSNPEVSDVNDKLGATLLKGPADNYAQWLYGAGLGINKDSKNKEAAWLFLQWRTSLMLAEKEVKDDLRIDFPLLSIYETDAYKENTKDQAFTELIPDITASVDGAYWPAVEEFEKVSQDFAKEISLSIVGGQDVKKALEKAQKNIQEELEK